MYWRIRNRDDTEWRGFTRNPDVVQVLLDKGFFCRKSNAESCKDIPCLDEMTDEELVIFFFNGTKKSCDLCKLRPSCHVKENEPCSVT